MALTHLAFCLLCSAVLGNALNYTIPQASPDAESRAAAINETRAGFVYGPALAGGPFYPSGPLGNLRAAADIEELQKEAVAQGSLIVLDAAQASNSTEHYEGLDTVEDYLLLYQGQWTNILPKGPAPGVLTNYSQDLFFSMERLANAAFSVRRLPKASKLPFQVDDSTISKVAGSSLQRLLKDGRLFYADHRAQANRPKTDNKFGPACDAYFYISRDTGKFLPLAIRTNVGSNLVYTPADEAADWTLAKIMFNVNDVYFTQMWHLAGTHEIVQIAWMAAIRTLSTSHPVYALLDRLMYQTFAVQPVAQSRLFDKGQIFDRMFPITGSATRDFTTELYFNGTGAFRAGYFENDLERRGLIHADGPELKHFPYYENASVIHKAIRSFVQAFVKSYYKSDRVVEGDRELQAWAVEANTLAKAIDFPSRFNTVDALVDALTHMAHLVSAVHHSVNTNNLATISATLPMHPLSLYKEVPTTKGNTSVAQYLPPLPAALEQFQVEGLFARPLIANSNRTLSQMFESPTFLSGTNQETRKAAEKFKETMKQFSKQMRGRSFDKDGLSLGAPFIWNALDPDVAPFSATI